MEEKDLKAEEVSEDTRQSETTEVDVESLKEQLKKAEEDRDKYKERVLGFSKKHPEKTLEPVKEETETEDESNWDEDSKRFQKQTLTQAEKIAQKAARETFERSNEKEAINIFLENHPEFQDKEEWNEIVSNYSSKNGKESVRGILKDLDRARVLRLHDKGDISKLAEEAERRGQLKGKAEAYHADSFTSGGVKTAHSDTSTSSVSKGAKSIAIALGIDPKKLDK
jgi:hypothetical protein